MTSRSMSATQRERFIKHCEAQGIKVSHTKSGLLLKFPDGSSTVQHFTESDSKAATRNQIARFRRAGVVHPDDPRGGQVLPSYITNGTISDTTRKRLIQYIIDSGFPESVTSPQVVKDLNWEPSQVNKALYHVGFKAGPIIAKRTPRKWYTPDDIMALKDKQPKTPLDVLRDTADRARKAQEVVNDLGAGKPEPIIERKVEGNAEEAERALHAAVSGAREAGRQVAQGMKDLGAIPPTPAPAESVAVHDPVVGEPDPRLVDNDVTVQKDGKREFIDSHESWTVDLKELIGDHRMRIIEDQLRILGVLGLNYEFRVWREKE